jgi:hypothetical protein
MIAIFQTEGQIEEKSQAAGDGEISGEITIAIFASDCVLIRCTLRKISDKGCEQGCAF